jgi:hypothetical protein
MIQILLFFCKLWIKVHRSLSDLPTKYFTSTLSDGLELSILYVFVRNLNRYWKKLADLYVSKLCCMYMYFS